MPKQLDRSVLEMALIGYQRSLENIQEKIADIQRQLGIRPAIARLPSQPAERNQGAR